MKPFSCWKCARSFSRQDSLARHIKRDKHVRASESVAQGQSNVAGATVMTDVLAINPFELPNPHFYNNGDSSLIDHQSSYVQEQPPLPNGGIDLATPGAVLHDPYFQLTWPDSEDFLQSLLSANFGSWQPPLEASVSQAHVQLSQYSPTQSAQSPWLTAEPSTSGSHGGNHAVRDLSKIITSLVSQSSLRSIFLSALY